MSPRLPLGINSAHDTDRSMATMTPRRPLRSRPKIAQVVAMEIVSDIVAAGLSEGDQLLTEAAMVERFDVGRASVREGLRLLEAFGIITIRQGTNGGPFVSGVKPEDVGRSLSLYFHISGATFGDLVDARLVIEPVMAKLAAEHQEPEVLSKLEKALERERTTSFGDPEFVESADNFHHVVSGMSGNKVLDIIGKALRTLYQDRIVYGARLPAPTRPQTRELHLAIGDSILRGDGVRAAALMYEDLAKIADSQQQLSPALAEELVGWTFEKLQGSS